jgi:cellulose synthase/poly-beta-1,6-N-acetylglucosamine synthase-like glycosyltransferase
MLLVKVIFWVALSLLLYLYFGYPLLLGLVAFFRRNLRRLDNAYKPTVSLIIAAYNEEGVISEKIENSLGLDYPQEKLDIIVFSDASTDRTDEIVKSYADQGVKLLRIEGRKGKTYCQNEAVQITKGEILVFSDANSMYALDAIQKLARHFADERVGCVSGELRYRGGGEAVEGERTYWEYDQIIKRLESKVSSLVGANGSIYAVPKELFDPLPAGTAEDLVRPLEVVQKGYRVVYEPDAVAWENTAQDVSMEFQRRVRIVTQSVRSLVMDTQRLSLLNPFRYGFFSIQLWSHKILRWLSGILLLLILALNIPLTGHSWVYSATMGGQVVFYLLVLWSFISEKALKQQVPKLPHIAYYFCLSCYAMLKGVYLGLRGRTMVTWQPSR